MEELNVIDKLPHYCPVCAYHEWNLDGLVEMIWDYIDVLRIYTKPKVSPRLGGKWGGRDVPEHLACAWCLLSSKPIACSFCQNIACLSSRFYIYKHML